MDNHTNHEMMHPVGSQPAWSESYYFNFVDPTSKIGMFTRMGFRPGDGWADALHVVYLPNQRVAFTYARRNIEHDLSLYDHNLKVGGLDIQCVSPHQLWSINYTGPAQNIADASVLLQRSKLRPKGWFTPANLDMSLNFDCITEPYHSHSTDGSTGAFGHFEQSGHVRGSITVDDNTWTVDGFGVRDKSWGPRDWGASQRKQGTSPDDQAKSEDKDTQTRFSTPASPRPFVNWFSMNFGADSALGGSCFRQPNGELKGAGWIQQDGLSMPLRKVVITTAYQANSILHDQVTLTSTIDGGEDVRITGNMLNVCPTKVPMANGATFINEGLAEFDWDGKKGFGIAEHWHAVALSKT